MMRLMITGVLAAALTVGQGVAAPMTACDVKLNVTDTDPAGLNVRAAPDGPVIGALKARNRWVQVHVTGDAGASAAIDHATLIQDETGGPNEILFRGRGFVALGKLGIETLNQETVIRAAPSTDAKILLTMNAPVEGPLPTAEVLGCDGVFLKVRTVTGLVGWTQNFCSNQLTTCN